MPRSRIALATLILLATASPTGATATTLVDPPFAITITTGPSWDTARPTAEQKHFATHSANLRRMKDAGVIVAGGRFGEFGLIIVRAPSADSAAAMMKPDSSMAVGTFRFKVDRWSTIYEGTISR